MKLRNRLALSMTGISLGFAAAIALAIGIQLVATSRAEYRANASSQIAMGEYAIDLFFGENRQLLASLARDPAVLGASGTLTSYAATTAASMPDPASYSATEGAVAALFERVQLSFDHIAQLELGLADGGYAMFPAAERSAGYDPRERPWYQTAIASSADDARTDARLTSDGSKIVVSLLRKIRDAAGGTIGVGSLSISLEDLTAIIGGIKIGSRGHVVLIQADGVILADPAHPENIFKNAADLPGDPYGASLSLAEGGGRASVTLGADRFDAVVRRFGDLGFIAVGLISEAEIQAKLRSTIGMIAAVAVIGAVAAGLVGFGLAGAIAGAISRITQANQRLADGDFTVAAVEDGGLSQLAGRKDEIGAAAGALSSMREAVGSVAATIRAASGGVAASASQVNALAQSLSAGTSEQASASQEVAASMEEMGAGIRQTAENAAATGEIAQRAARGIAEGDTAIEKAVAAISDIAGLSVATIGTARSARDLIASVVPDIGRTADLVLEIAATSREQNTGTAQINDALGQLDQVVQRNAASAEELASMAEQLTGQAGELKDAVAYFATDAAEAGRPEPRRRSDVKALVPA